jgi:hypothetical protein
VRTRAYRRAQTDKWKRRVRWYYWAYDPYWGRMPHTDPKTLGKLATTRTPCSCWMCRSEWRSFGIRPIRDRRAMQED